MPGLWGHRIVKYYAKMETSTKVECQQSDKVQRSTQGVDFPRKDYWAARPHSAWASGMNSTSRSTSSADWNLKLSQLPPGLAKPSPENRLKNKQHKECRQMAWLIRNQFDLKTVLQAWVSHSGSWNPTGTTYQEAYLGPSDLAAVPCNLLFSREQGNSRVTGLQWKD